MAKTKKQMRLYNNYKMSMKLKGKCPGKRGSAKYMPSD